MTQVKMKSGAIRFYPSLAEIMEASNNMEGFCIACGETAYGVEPDAECYECETCGEPKVYGAEQCAIMGYVRG